MLWITIFVGCCCLFQVQANENESPRIIIIGSGPAGVAAGTRLLENGFNNVTILEAENRIGGRVYTTQFNGYSVDIGGQWVVGEENNPVFEMVWPLGLIDKSTNRTYPKLFGSSGFKMPEDVGNRLNDFYFNLSAMGIPEEWKNQTIGDWYTHKLDEYFEIHPDITKEQRESLKNMFNMMEMSEYASDSWFNISLDQKQTYCKGNQLINWKERGYGTIIDVLLKKIPNPSEELPFINKTVLNAEVSRINYNNTDGTVSVMTENGKEYLADHVIVTPSLGVLKANHEKLFNPSLSEVKINAIKGFEYGSVAKIYLFYPEPWWPKTDSFFGLVFFWTNEDRKEFAENPKKSWLLGLNAVVEVEHKPKLLCAWLVGPWAREMETLPEKDVLSNIKEVLHRFLERHYNLTEPTAMLRTQWYTNKHFQGTYSYRSPETERLGALNVHLEEPIMEQGNPRVLFAGEATSSNQSGTVHGAISTGWREADRLIKFYDDRKTTVGTSR